MKTCRNLKNRVKTTQTGRTAAFRLDEPIPLEELNDSTGGILVKGTGLKNRLRKERMQTDVEEENKDVWESLM